MKPEAKWAAVLNLFAWFLIVDSLRGLLISVLDMMPLHSVLIMWGDFLCIFGGLGLLFRERFWRSCLVFYFWICLGFFFLENVLFFLNRVGIFGWLHDSGQFRWRNVLVTVFYAGCLWLLSHRKIKALFPPPSNRHSANE